MWLQDMPHFTVIKQRFACDYCTVSELIFVYMCMKWLFRYLSEDQ